MRVNAASESPPRAAVVIDSLNQSRMLGEQVPTAGEANRATLRLVDDFPCSTIRSPLPTGEPSVLPWLCEGGTLLC